VKFEIVGKYYIQTGYMNLKKPDQAMRDHWKAILLSMLSSF